MSFWPDVKPTPEVGFQDDGSYIAKVTEHWVMVVTPMIVNDRIQIAAHEEFGRTYTAAFCFSRPGGSRPFSDFFTSDALAAAAAWDPETEREPQGHVKVAYDSRKGSLL